jgi:hypothetical protein
MSSPYDAQELPRLRAEFARLGEEFRNWLCWVRHEVARYEWMTSRRVR